MGQESPRGGVGLSRSLSLSLSLCFAGRHWAGPLGIAARGVSAPLDQLEL